MAGTTPVYGYPYPEPPDPADGPSAIRALAEAVEPTVKSAGDAAAAVDSRLVIGPASSVPASLPDGTIYFGY